MRATVNGEVRELPEGATVREMLDSLGVKPERVAVERNLEVVKRDRWTETRLAEGDVLEIVQFVGGG
jgi:thiamine biosynthesis protein ThiS